MKLKKQIFPNLSYLWQYKPNNIEMISESEIVSMRKHTPDVQ